MNTRNGSFLVVCLSLMILMVVLAFAALHEIRLQVQTSTGNERYLLAQAAARSGLDHALEQIVTDYNSNSIQVRSDSAAGGISLPAITFLDGQYRAPFTATSSPNTTNTNNYSLNVIDNDVRSEDYVCSPWAWWWFESRTWWSVGMYDGKGRYYEPGYYNSTPQPPGSTVPVAPELFSDPNAPIPERTQAIFYDDQFCRLKSSGNLQQDRRNARYRLRYTVGVEDLSGHLLVNPIPDMQMLATAVDGTALTVDYRNPEVRYPWMTAAANALAASYGAVNTAQLGAQLEHVFKGRGYQTNVDLDHSPTGLSGTPITFPYSYRNHSANPADQSPGCWASWIDSAGNGSLTTNLYWSTIGTPKGLKEGGEAIPNWSWNDGVNFWPYGSNVMNHCLVGPQLSFENVTYASQGNRAYLGAQDGGGGNGWPKFGLTPFGRCMTSNGYKPAGPNKWYQGRVDTPFCLNLMTAPPAIVNSILVGYLPPREKLFQFYTCSFYKYTGLDANGNQTYVLEGAPSALPIPPPAAPVPIDENNGYNEISTYGRDLLVDTTAPPAFSQWPAPERVDQPLPAPVPALTNVNPPGATGIGQHIKPDYYGIDDRKATATYPGPFMNGLYSNPHEDGDDLGLNMDENSLNVQCGSGAWGGWAYGLDPHDGQCFVYPNPSDQTKHISDFPPTNNPPVDSRTQLIAWTTAQFAQVPLDWGFNQQDMAIKNIDPTKVSNSYFYDMLYSMATAISVFRASYVQYDNSWIPASKLFAAGDQTPEKYQTLRDLDRIFLAQIGESLEAPGTGFPQVLHDAGTLKAYHMRYPYWQPAFTADYVPKNNILSLVAGGLQNKDGTVTSAQRGHVLELLLNDFRMSFMGSSPLYSDVPSDVTKEFRPLDFDHDGRAYCSCYNNVDTDNLPCAPAGTKPDNYFTITGNFFLGKSHYYRVFSRGEIWDNLLNIKLNDATLDSVLTVDPEGTDPTQTQFLYQRWFYNRYLAMLPRVQR